jgi:tetratricopeptide (TPR) repeat protein
MKRIIYLLFLVSSLAWSQNHFEEGNAFYAKENYQEAINSYEKVLESGKESAEVYFNLGNSYYKLHKVAPAIYNFEKALLLKPTDNEIKTNLEFAQKKAIDEIKVVSKVGFDKMIQDVTSSYHYNTWAWISIIFSALVLVFFIAYYFSKEAWKKRVFFAVMLLFLLGIPVSIFAGFFQKNQIDNDKPAIIFAEKTTLKSEPKTSSPDTFTLHEGTKVYILESVANWKKVQLTDESTGWIESSALKELK